MSARSNTTRAPTSAASNGCAWPRPSRCSRKRPNASPMHATPKSAAASATIKTAGMTARKIRVKRSRATAPNAIRNVAIPAASALAFQPLHRDPRSPGKQQQHSQREEREAGAVAQESAERLPRTERHVSAERRLDWNALWQRRANESLGRRALQRDGDDLGGTDQEGGVRAERRAVERSVGDG